MSKNISFTGKILQLGLLLVLFSSLASATITASQPWVEIHQNAADTQEVTIGVSGFGVSEDVTVQVQVDGRTITNALGEPTVIHTILGMGSARFKPTQGSYTGRATITATSPTRVEVFQTAADTQAREAQGLTLEDVINDTASAGGRTIKFVVHSTQQSVDAVLNDPVTPRQALDIMTTTYRRQVGSWGYDQHIDDYDNDFPSSDGVVHVYLHERTGDPFNPTPFFHQENACQSHQGGARIDCAVNIRNEFTKTAGLYSPAEALLGHEHFHSVEFSFFNHFFDFGKPKWSPDDDWYTEGMARFSETITSTSEVFDPRSLCLLP